MLKLNCIQRYHKYIGGIIQIFQKSYTGMQCNTYFHSKCGIFTRSVMPKMLPIAYNIGVHNQFKTCYASCNEESDAVDQIAEGNKKLVDSSKDRTRIISPETSIRYLKSEAYKATYGDEPVWVKYRRNFKGQFVPNRTRKTCIRDGVITTGNPCPICRDEYLVLHYTNVDLLKQFIRPETGEIYDTRKIHVCQKRILELEVALKKAKYYGLLTYQVPFRKYDYKEYYPQWIE